MKPSRKSTGSSSAPVRRALASAGAMTLRHSSRCSRMISPTLLKSRSASTCVARRVAAWGRHPHRAGAARPRSPPGPTAPPLTSQSSPDSCRFSRQQRKSCGTEQGAVGCSHSLGPPLWHGATGASTHVRDDLELADVGGLSVQQLPDGFLLVGLPARQGLRGRASAQTSSRAEPPWPPVLPRRRG